MEHSSRGATLARQIVAYPANTPCPVCGGNTLEWPPEGRGPAQAPEFYKGLRALDCPPCGGWVLYKERQVQAVPAGSTPQKTRRIPLQAARWAKSQSRQGNLRDYLDQSTAGQQYRGYFTDSEVQDADAAAQADPRYQP